MPRLEIRGFWVPVALESRKSSLKARFHPIPTDSTFPLPNAPFSPFLASVSHVLPSFAVASRMSTPKAVFQSIATESTFPLPNAPFSLFFNLLQQIPCFPLPNAHFPPVFGLREV